MDISFVPPSLPPFLPSFDFFPVPLFLLYPLPRTYLPLCSDKTVLFSLSPFQVCDSTAQGLKRTQLPPGLLGRGCFQQVCPIETYTLALISAHLLLPASPPSFSFCGAGDRAACRRYAPGDPSACPTQHSWCQARAVRVAECLWNFSSEKSGV